MLDGTSTWVVGALRCGGSCGPWPRFRIVALGGGNVSSRANVRCSTQAKLELLRKGAGTVLRGVSRVRHVGRDDSARRQGGAGGCVAVNLRDQAQPGSYWWLCAVACGQPGVLRLSRIWPFRRWMGAETRKLT